MPVSHITLTVSHLPTSTSFFLSCLQPLGYQFIGRHDDYIGFGQKQGEPADFWMTEQKPGVPPGAVHVAFPAPSKDAVGSFFISALKAGGKIHGEPKERDSQTGYFSAAIIDFDGNSIEAVYRPTSSGASVISAASGPTMALLENKDSRSVVSKVSSKAPSVKAESFRAESVRAESIAPPRSEAHSRAISKAPTAIERSAPTVVSKAQSYAPSQQQHGLQTPPQTPPKTDDGSKAAKTIVGTLIGAAAGAAIAYAMVKGENSSNTELPSPMQYVTNFAQLKSAPSQASHEEEEPAPNQFRALEAPPPRSEYAPRSEYGRSEYARSEYARSQYTAASAPRTTLTRSVTSKNPRASTIYEGTEFMHDDPGRRASEGSIYSIPENLPLRAIEYPPPSNASQQRYPCNPSTFISSYANDKPRNNSSGSIHSSSTIKASQSNMQRRHSSDDRDGYSTHSSHHSQVHSQSHSQQTVYRAASTKSASIAPSSHRGSPPSATGSTKEPSIAPSTRSARDIPLPQSSQTTTYTNPSAHSRDHHPSGSTTKHSHISARQIPLPQGSISTFYSSPSIAGETYHGAGGEVTRTADKTSYISLSPRDIFLPESVLDVDVNSIVTPDDSISQVGHGHHGRSRSRHSHHSQARSHRSRSRSHRSSHSRASKRDPSVHSKAASKAASKIASRSGSKFEDPVGPADSVSQVSRASQRTAKAPESRRGSQVV